MDPVVPFPMPLHFGEEPQTNFKTENEALRVTLYHCPHPDIYKELCYRMIMSTWRRDPHYQVTPEEMGRAMIELLQGKVLPNSMESLVFTFLIEGLTHIEISHMLRHRTFFGIHALCTGDRDLRHDEVMIPESIKNSKFRERYEQVSKDAKQLYAEMVDSKDITLMDARYILTRNHTYYYYFSMNLKDAIMFINQRKCTMIQPYTDNLIAHAIYDLINQTIPELEEVVSMKCGPSCHFVKSSLEKNTRLYQPDATHAKYMPDFNPENYVYSKRRHEMGVPKTCQDD